MKYASKPFGQMNDAELHNWALGLLTKIHIITGWTLPTDSMLDILLDQFQKKLVESYPNTNVDEVEYAFRTGGTTVKDWGKNMNLSLIDEVMIPYLESRKSVSRMEEQKRIEAPKEQEDLSDKAMNDWMNDVCGQVKNGVISIDFVPEMLYDWLDKTERYRIGTVEKRMYMQMAVKHRKAQLIENSSKSQSIEDFNTEANFLEMEKSGFFSGKELERLKTLAKKMVVYDYLKEKE